MNRFSHEFVEDAEAQDRCLYMFRRTDDGRLVACGKPRAWHDSFDSWADEIQAENSPVKD